MRTMHIREKEVAERIGQVCSYMYFSPNVDGFWSTHWVWSKVQVKLISILSFVLLCLERLPSVLSTAPYVAWGGVSLLREQVWLGQVQRKEKWAPIQGRFSSPHIEALCLQIEMKEFFLLLLLFPSFILYMDNSTHISLEPCWVFCVTLSLKMWIPSSGKLACPLLC